MPASAPSARVSAAYARALVSRFGVVATERAALLEGTLLDERTLAAAGAEIDLNAFMRLLENVTRAHGEEWPLQAGQVWSNAMQGALDVAARSAPTLGDAFDVLGKYGKARGPYLAVERGRTKAAQRVIIHRDTAVNDAAWRAVSYAVALSVHAELAQLCDGALQGRVTFPWPAPPFVERLRALVGLEVQFDAPHFMIEIPAALCARPSPFADPALHASAIAELERMVPAGDGPIVSDVVRIVVSRLPERIGEAEAARALGLSRRSLVRRLSRAGASYRALLDEALRARAKALLARTDLTRADMAAALGYADPTSFSRACRRWFGVRRTG